MARDASRDALYDITRLGLPAKDDFKGSDPAPRHQAVVFVHLPVPLAPVVKLPPSQPAPVLRKKSIRR